MVGETGSGKTTIIQELAGIVGIKVNVLNLSHSTDIIDLFGGYRPLNKSVFYKYAISCLRAFVTKFYSPGKN